MQHFQKDMLESTLKRSSPITASASKAKAESYVHVSIASECGHFVL